MENPTFFVFLLQTFFLTNANVYVTRINDNIFSMLSANKFDNKRFHMCNYTVFEKEIE